METRKDMNEEQSVPDQPEGRAGKEHLLIVNDFHASTLAGLEELYHCHRLWEAESEEARRRLIDELSGCCRAAATASWSSNELVYELPQLEMIACFGVGTDAIDTELTRRRGIRVSNTPSVLDDDVADLAIALILMSLRQLPQADRFVRQGRWSEGPFPFGHSLKGRTLGILGLGNIGLAIARRAETFGMHIVYHNRSPRDLPWPWLKSPEALASRSDVLLSMLPGGEPTRKLIGEAILERLGPKGIFINVGRGSTVDEAALIKALQQGRIAGAGLDVYADEPRVPAALRNLDNTVLLPHIGSATVETRQAMGQLVIDNLKAYFKGETLPTELKQN